jgi:carbonic anhydrase
MRYLPRCPKTRRRTVDRNKYFELNDCVSASSGPENWPHHFELCGGQSQSPINIVTSDVVSLEVSRLTLNGYETKLGDDFPVVNNGHSGKTLFHSAYVEKIFMS